MAHFNLTVLGSSSTQSIFAIMAPRRHPELGRLPLPGPKSPDAAIL